MGWNAARIEVERYRDMHPNLNLVMKDALNAALAALETVADYEERVAGLKLGEPVWYVDQKTKAVEECMVLDVKTRNDYVVSVSVMFPDNAISDMKGHAVGTCLFLTEQAARNEARKDADAP